MSVATARAELGAALIEALGDAFVVFPDPTDENSTDEISKPTLVLERTRVEQAPGMTKNIGAWMNTFNLHVILPTGSNEDDMDGALEEVLEALDEATETVWDSADRGVWDSTNPAWVITIRTPSTRN